MALATGLSFPWRSDNEVCVSCGKRKKGVYVESPDGTVSGFLCWTHAKTIFNVHVPLRPSTNLDMAPVESNGAEREAARV
jgi:hypothetical protein